MKTLIGKFVEEKTFYDGSNLHPEHQMLQIEL